MSLDLFNLTPGQIEKTLNHAMARGGDFADLFAEHTLDNGLVMEEGILKSASHTLQRGVGIRVVHGEKTGYAYTEHMDPQQFLKIAGTAAAIADDSGHPESVKVNPHRLNNYYPVTDLTSNVALDQKIAWIEKMDRYARAVSEKVSKVNISFSDSQTTLVMADTRGRLVIDEQPMLQVSISVIAEKDGVREKGKAGGGGRLGFSFLTEDRVRHWAESAAKEAILLLDAQQAPAGMLPVVLAAGDSGILLHEAIGHPLEADFNRKGTSAYTQRIGEMVADPQCTIIDDGTVPHDRGSINVDDELNDSQKTVLIEQGRLKAYMSDEMSARYFETESTGNGRRESYHYAPMPRMRTTYMLPGEYDPEELIRSTSKGVFCRTFKNGQVDISNGNFIFVPSEAYLIEDGKLSYPIKNFSLIGNGPDVLSKVTMVANDFKFSDGIWTCGKGQSVPVGVGLPTVKISEMTVGGRSQ